MKRTFRMRGAGIVAAAIGIGIGTLVAAAPASAAAGDNCPSGYFCVYVDGGATGAQYNWPNSGAYTNMPPAFHDKGSSWANKTSRTWKVYDQSGTVVLDTVGAGVVRTSVPLGANDKIDSIGPA